MGIFTRLNTVLKSNLNSLLDGAEDPEKMIGQTVVDLETEVKKARKELVSTLGTAKRLDKKADELEAEAIRWEEKATLAIREGDEGLAREALRLKLKTQGEAATVREQSAQQDRAAGEMKATLESVDRKIDDLKARQGTLAAQVRRAREAPGTGPAGAGGRFGSETFNELERMTGRIDQLEAEVEASNVLEEPRRAEVEAKFRDLERRTASGAVEDELAALKKKLGG